MAINTSGKVGAITFGVFFAEAMLHYNIGIQHKDPKAKLQLPPLKQVVEITGVVLLFSVVNAVLISKLLKIK